MEFPFNKEKVRAELKNYRDRHDFREQGIVHKCLSQVEEKCIEYGKLGCQTAIIWRIPGRDEEGCTFLSGPSSIIWNSLEAAGLDPVIRYGGFFGMSKYICIRLKPYYGIK